MRLRSRKAAGLTILEVLVAMAVLVVAFSALAFTQIASMSATARNRNVTVVKAAATRVLEDKMRDILGNYANPSNASERWYYFTDYYESCPTVLSSPSRPLANPLPCSGTVKSDGNTVTSTWVVQYEPGALDGEGQLRLTVTAARTGGPTLSLVNIISCYDIYPSPTVGVPTPCPTDGSLTASGAGRT